MLTLIKFSLKSFYRRKQVQALGCFRMSSMLAWWLCLGVVWMQPVQAKEHPKEGGVSASKDATLTAADSMVKHTATDSLFSPVSTYATAATAIPTQSTASTPTGTLTTEIPQKSTSLALEKSVPSHNLSESAVATTKDKAADKMTDTHNAAVTKEDPLAALTVASPAAKNILQWTQSALQNKTVSGLKKDTLAVQKNEKFVSEVKAMEATTASANSTHDIAQSLIDGSSKLIKTATDWLGVRYRLGGTTPETGFDCSSFVRAVFEKSAGFLLPRVASAQAAATTKIEKFQLQVGDLVFFNTLGRAFSHVGIYIGNGKFIHAPRTGSVVRIESMEIPYWKSRFNGARRVPLTSDRLKYLNEEAAKVSSAAVSGHEISNLN